jgi:uncharacterized protein (DUF362 family)/NAD-dependent dihydropyrimidine dehydrogenase PreA subunit
LLKKSIDDYLKKNNLKIQNEKILLKPNLISLKSKDKAVNTHPIIVQAISEYLSDFNNKLFIGDSPGVGTLKLNLKVSGYGDILKKMDISIYSFDHSCEVIREENKILKNFKIAKAAFDFDKIINIAKLKTHCMTGMTLSVKNCFGFIVGKEKIKYHLKAGHNIKLFADILIDIYETVKPFVNIIDGIVGMEGNGPTSGVSKDFGIFAMSQNGYLLDRAIERVVGFHGKTIISQQAESRGLLEKKFDLKTTIKQRKIKHAKTKSANFRIPKVFTNFFQHKPFIDNRKCKKCLKCYESCPPHAIYMKEEKLKVDYSKCIRCYCCHELCLHNAVKFRRLFF